MHCMLKPVAVWPKTFWNYVDALQSICWAACGCGCQCWWFLWRYAPCAWTVWSPWLQPIPFRLYGEGGCEEATWVPQICLVLFLWGANDYPLFPPLPTFSSLFKLFLMFSLRPSKDLIPECWNGDCDSTRIANPHSCLHIATGQSNFAIFKLWILNYSRLRVPSTKVSCH